MTVPKDTLPGRVSLSCAFCGKTYSIKRSQFLRGNARFCSPVCHGQHQRSQSILLAEERFWANVAKSEEPDGCWLWLGSAKTGTHGNFKIGDRRVQASHFAWELANGRPVPDGRWVLHHCDNPPRVRPDHLYVGTHLDNVRDAVERDRYAIGIALHRDTRARGTHHGSAKLREADVVAIRVKRTEGATLLQLAREFGISRSQVHRIVHDEAWQHL